jgi:hypothetical protein
MIFLLYIASVVMEGVYKPAALGRDGEWGPVDMNLENRLSQPAAPMMNFAKVDNDTAFFKASIFVGIAAFREQRCGRTLFDAFTKAHNARRVFFGVVDQLLTPEEDSQSCLRDYCRLVNETLLTRTNLDHVNLFRYATENPVRSPYAAKHLRSDEDCAFSRHVRVDRRDAHKSRGPTFARYQQQLLVRNEEFCLQVDSHTLFAVNWDGLLIHDWLKARNEYAVLTTYLPHIDQIQVQDNERSVTQTVPHICRTVC